jgi:hypothetical protein
LDFSASASLQAAEAFLCWAMRMTFAALVLAAFLPSCATEDDEESRKPVGPQSTSSQLPWNLPKPGQGGGAFGALPQQPRR